MSQVVKHKLALYEIFEAKMATGQSLDGNCDAILKTEISKLPSNVEKFIVLGRFIVSPVPSGRLTDKLHVVMQDIMCGGVSIERNVDGDTTAEFWAWTLAKLVRTILRNNQTLTCATYSTGVARKTFINEAPQEFVLFYDTPCCIHTISLEIHMEEDAS